MTGEIVTREEFQGIPVRVVQREGIGAIPLNDIADGIGLDRSGLHKLLKRNERVLAPYVSMVNMSTDAGARETICLTRDGVIGILMKTDFGKMKDPVKQANVIEFQKWAIETLSKVIRDESVLSINCRQVDIKVELVEAKELAALCDKPQDMFLEAVFRKRGKPEFADLLALPANSIVHGEAGVWLNPSQIGMRCGHTAREVNHYLNWHKYQYRDANGFWRLDEKGLPYGEEYWFESPTKHREIRIRWQESLLIASGLIKDPPGQTALAEG